MSAGPGADHPSDPPRKAPGKDLQGDNVDHRVELSIFGMEVRRPKCWGSLWYIPSPTAT
jgi:hypothetical protein